MVLRVVGVDVEPGCKSGSRCFSVAVLESGKLVAKHEAVPLHRLIRLLWEYRPDVLALDNVRELASSKRELARVLSLIPPGTSVVQTTRLPDGRMVDLRRLARLAGLDPGSSKLSPSKTAYYAALLAEMGYGTPLRVVEEKTRIVVARSRRLKHGGMSSRRYQRRVRSAILRAAKDIKKVLDRSGLDYDLMFRKSGGGLDSAVFIVYAPRSSLNGLVKPYEDNDVRIEIEAVYRSEAVFETLEMPGVERRKPFLIVGVDPGISTGIAAVDLEGRPVLAVSRRGIDRGEVIELIRQYGVPVLVATDVTPAPEFVRKLASTLRVPVYEPPAPLSVEEKREILDTYSRRYPGLRRVADSHVRDALAAAVKAYHSYEGKLRQIEAYISRLDMDIDAERVKAEVIRGISIAEAVERAIDEILSREEQAETQEEPAGGAEEPAEGETGRRPRDRSELEALRAENYALRRRLRALEEELRALQLEFRVLSLELRDELERDREIRALRERINLLQAELEKERKRAARGWEEARKAATLLYRVAAGQLVPAPLLRCLSSSSVEQLTQLSEEHGRLLLALETFNPVHWEQYSSRLRGLILALLVPGSQLDAARQAVEKHHVPVLPLEQYERERLTGITLLDPSAITDAYARLTQILEEERRRREKRGLDAEGLRRLLAEYRARRARLLLDQNNGA